MGKSFKHRLEALEALDAAQAARTLGTPDDDRPPDVATLDDAEAVAWALGALVDGQMYTWWERGTGRLWICELGLKDIEWELFFRAVKGRVQPLIDAAPKPVVLLPRWAIDDTLALMDAGRVDVVDHWPAAAAPHGSFWRLRVDRCVGTDDEAIRVVRAVNKALESWAEQQGLGQVGPWELTTLADWRAWLTALKEDEVNA